MTDPRAEAEAKMGLEPVQQRTEERAHLVQQNAKRRVLYGGMATWKFHRDRLEALIAMEKRRDLAADGAKVTDKIVSEHVLTDPRMKSFIDAAEDEAVAYHIAEDAIQAVNDRGQRDTEIARSYAAEARFT